MEDSEKQEPGRSRRLASRIGSLPLKKLWLPIGIVVLGLVLGGQIYNPSKRVIEAAVGLTLIALLWNFSTVAAVWLLIVIYPLPFGISIGSSNLIFAVLIFIIYMIRVSSKHENFHLYRLTDLPIALFVLAYLLSFYNMKGTPHLVRWGLVHTATLFSAILLYYMIVNLVDDLKKLRFTVIIMCVTVFIAVTVTLLEILFPGRQIIPSLVYSVHEAELVMKDIRVKGPFHDYELLAQFSAINIPIILFMAVRSKRLLSKVIFTILVLMVLFMLFSTITRGAFISLMVGLIYLAFICRKDLNIVKITILVAVLIFVMVSIDTFMTKYTVSGSLFHRLVGTTFERGFIPDTRVDSWTGAVDRWLRHPIIGNGPGWDFTHGIEAGLWPHNGYLFILNITGIFGLIAFLFLLYRLVRVSIKQVGVSLTDASFARSLMKVLHVCLVIFIVDTAKIDFLRNNIYLYFVWIFFGMIGATAKQIAREEEAAAAEKSVIV